MKKLILNLLALTMFNSKITTSERKDLRTRFVNTLNIEEPSGKYLIFKENTPSVLVPVYLVNEKEYIDTEQAKDFIINYSNALDYTEEYDFDLYDLGGEDLSDENGLRIEKLNKVAMSEFPVLHLSINDRKKMLFKTDILPQDPVKELEAIQKNFNEFATIIYTFDFYSEEEISALSDNANSIANQLRTTRKTLKDDNEFKAVIQELEDSMGSINGFMYNLSDVIKRQGHIDIKNENIKEHEDVFVQKVEEFQSKLNGFVRKAKRNPDDLTY